MKPSFILVFLVGVMECLYGFAGNEGKDSGFINYVLNSPELASEQYTVERIDFELEDAASTQALYRLTNGQSRLIVKELSSCGKEQIDRLNQSKAYLERHPLKDPAPVVVLPLFTGCYKEAEVNRYFIVLPEARGVDFDTLFDRYFSDEVTYKEVISCVSKLGEAIASLHLQGLVDNRDCETHFVHDDLHGGNIFCYKGGFISLIDNEYLQRSIENHGSIVSDLRTLLLQSVRLPSVFIADAQIVPEIKRREIIELIVSFLKDYVKNIDGNCFEIISRTVRQTAEEAYGTLMGQGISIVTFCEKEAIIQQLLVSLKN